MNSLISDDVVMLRALDKTDIDGDYLQWFNNPEVVKYNSHGRFPMTRDSLEKYIESTESNPSLLVLAVILLDMEKHVGNISLQNINWVDRSAEIAFILGDANLMGKGIMFRAGGLLIRHAFNQLNLRRVYCGTLDSNDGMKKLAIKLGMQEEGRRREAVYKSGEYVDVLEYGLLRSTQYTS